MEAYQKMSIFDFLEEEPVKARDKNKKYSIEEIRAYIINHYDKDISYHNNIFYNIIMNDYFKTNYQCGFSIPPEEQFEEFKELYGGFTYHFQNDKFTVFSLHIHYDNTDDEYRLFIKVKDDYIVGLPRIKDIFKEELTAPACAISWYTKEGKFVDSGGYMKLKDNETITTNGVKIYGNAREEEKYTYSYNRMDRRNYYFFNLLGIQHYGKKRFTDDDKKAFDCFCQFEWKYKDMIDFMIKEGGENNDIKGNVG